VIEAHDTLIVNPRGELIGEDQAAILTDFIVHMLDLQLKQQLAVPRGRCARVSLIIDGPLADHRHPDHESNSTCPVSESPERSRRCASSSRWLPTTDLVRARKVS
jgi:hypothetical protein